MDQPHKLNQPKPANKHDQHGESDQPHEPIQNIHDQADEIDQPVIPDQHNEPNNLPFNNQDKPEHLNHSADHDQPRETNTYFPDDIGRYLGPSNENDTGSDTSENKQTEKDEAKEELLKILDLKDYGKVFIKAAFLFALFAIVLLGNKETTQSSTKESCGIPTWIVYFRFAQSCTECELYALHMSPRPRHLDEDDDWIISVHLPRPCLPNTTHQQHATENNHSTSHLRIPVSRQQLGQYNVPELQLQDHDESVSLENEYLRIGNALDANGAEEISVINTDHDLYQPAIPNTTCDVRVAEEARTTNENTMEENSQCAKLNNINGEQRNQAGGGLQVESIFQDDNEILKMLHDQGSVQRELQRQNDILKTKVRDLEVSSDKLWKRVQAQERYIRTLESRISSQEGQKGSNEYHETTAKENTSVEKITKTAKMQTPNGHIDKTRMAGADTVAFHATFPEDKTIDHMPVGSPIQFKTVTLNIRGGYHPSTSLFIATKPGVYIFSTSVMSSLLNDISVLHVGILKNGQYLAGAYAASSGGAEQGSVTVTTQLQVGDEVWVEHVVHDGGAVSGNSLTSFTGCLIFPM